MEGPAPTRQEKERAARQRREEDRQRLEDMSARLMQAQARVGEVEMERDRLAAENRLLRLNSSLLVENLSDAWWVQAAHALDALKGMMDDDGGMVGGPTAGRADQCVPRPSAA